MSMPCLKSLGQTCAALAALVLTVWATHTFAAGENDELSRIGLRTSISTTAGSARSQSAQASDRYYGVPPGAGAGDTGFISASEALRRSKKVKKQKKTSSTKSDPAPTNLGPTSQRAQKLNSSPLTTSSLYLPRRKKFEDDPFEPLGFHAGAFLLRPSIELSSGYDDNPFRVQNGPGSAFSAIKSQLNAKSDWSRHEVSLDLRGAYTVYENVDHNNRPDAAALLRGRIDVSRDTRIVFEESAILTTQAAGTPNAVTGAKTPPLIYTFGSSAGVIQQFNRFEVGVYGGIERTNYQDADLIGGGTLDLSENNYTSYFTRLRGSYESTPGMKPFVEVGIDKRVFDDEVNSFGVIQGSNGFKGRVGVAFDRPEIIKGEAAIGYISRSYNDPTVRDISGLLVDSSLIWKATPLTKIILNVSTTINDSTTTDAVGIFTREGRLAVEHSFRRWLVGSLFGSYAEDNYVGANRIDHRMTYGAALNYALSRELVLRGELKRERLISNVADQDYTANIAMIGLRLQR